jgi:hypothetical protein
LQDPAKDKHGHSQSRSATFITAIRFFEGLPPCNTASTASSAPAPASENLWPLPTPGEIYKYVGVSPSSENATGAMWETVFVERLEKSDSDLDLDEVNLIGRSFEKILQVDIVPASFSNTNGIQDQAVAKQETDIAKDKQDQAKDKEQTSVSASIQETAIVSNLFVRPNVDLKALL